MCGEPDTDMSETLQGVAQEQWGSPIDSHGGQPPDTWEDWTRRAEAGLLEGLGIDDTQAVAYRGGAPSCCAGHKAHPGWEVGNRANHAYQTLSA